MRRHNVIILLTLFVLQSSVPFVSATSIDFGPSLPGAPTGHDTVLIDQLVSYGVSFSTTDPEGVFWWGPTYFWPPARYSIHAGDIAEEGVEAGVDPIRVDFNPYVVEASIRGFDGGGDVDTLLFKAFDSADALVDSMTITNDFSTPGSIASVSAPEIAYVTFEVSVPGDHGLFFDDLNYVVPEPTTLLLLGLGAVMVRRKR